MPKNKKLESEIYRLKEEQLLEGINYCIDKTRELIDAAEILVKNKKTQTLALGLYTIAAEEYGKSLLLKKCKISDDKYLVPRILFKGNKAHGLKLKEAHNNLPTECRIFSAGVEIDFIGADEYVEVAVGPKGEKINVAGTGIFSAGSFPADLDARLACFYVDWNDEKKQWLHNLLVLGDDLNESIVKFKEHIQKKFPTNKSNQFPKKKRIDE